MKDGNLSNRTEQSAPESKTIRKSFFTVLLIITIAAMSFSLAGCASDPIVGTFVGEVDSMNVSFTVNSDKTFDFTIGNGQANSGTWEMVGERYDFTFEGFTMYAVVGENGMTLSEGDGTLYFLTRVK